MQRSSGTLNKWAKEFGGAVGMNLTLTPHPQYIHDACNYHHLSDLTVSADSQLTNSSWKRED